MCSSATALSAVLEVMLATAHLDDRVCTFAFPPARQSPRVMRAYAFPVAVAAAALVATGVGGAASAAQPTDTTIPAKGTTTDKRFLGTFVDRQRLDGLVEIVEIPVESHNKLRELLVKWCLEDREPLSEKKSTKGEKMKTRHRARWIRALYRQLLKSRNRSSTRKLGEEEVDCRI